MRTFRRTETGETIVKSRINSKLSTADHPDIWELYAKGWSQRQIAERYKVTQARISQILSELSVDMPQISREELISTFLNGCRELYESAMDDVRSAPVAHRSAARRDAQMVLDRLAQIASVNKRPMLPAGTDPDVRYVVEGISSEELAKALTLCRG